jgi:hypothetical protein
MAADEGASGQAGDERGDGLADLGGDLLNDDDRRLILDWRESLTLQDPRYEDKGVLALAVLAMVNEDVRYRLLNDDLEGVLGDAPAIRAQLPEGVTLKFVENSDDTLNVVLLPRPGEMGRRSIALRDMLRSRTAAGSLFQDDYDLFKDGFNLSGLKDAFVVGDSGGRDSFA